MQHNQIKLETSAHESIMQDKANVVLTIEVVKPTKAQVQFELKQKAEAAFKIIKKISKVESSTQGQSISDNMTLQENKYVKDGFKGLFNISLVSKDFEKLNEVIDLVQEIAQVSQIVTGISTVKTLEVEDKLTQQAIKTFKDRAQLISKSFGFTGYQLLEIDISRAQTEYENGNHSYHSVANVSSALGKASLGADSLDSSYVQPRNEKITVTIDGSIHMSKTILD